MNFKIPVPEPPIDTMGDMEAVERDNIIRWDGKRRGWYEVWFCKLVYPAENCGFWFRYTLLAPSKGLGEPVSELWGMFYDGSDAHRNMAIKETFPIAHLQADRQRFHLQLNGAILGHGQARGRLLKGNQRIEWDLSFEPNSEPYYHLFPLLRRLEITKTRICSPHLDTRWSGRLTVNDREIILTGAPGQQSHIWGIKHAERWTWAHCNAFAGQPDVVLEGFSAVIKVGPWTLPPLTPLHIRYRGEAYTFNRPGSLLRNRSRFRLGSWEFEAEGEAIRFAGEVHGKLENLIGVRYTDPDGEPRFCYHDELADCRLQVFHRRDGNWQQVDELVAKGTCAGEWAGREQVPEVLLSL